MEEKTIFKYWEKSTEKIQTYTIIIPRIRVVNSVITDNGIGTVISIVGDAVTIEFSGGTSFKEQTGGNYIPEQSKTATDTMSNNFEDETFNPTLPNRVWYNQDGFKGWLNHYNTTVVGPNIVYHYSGTVTKPAVDTRTYTDYWEYEAWIKYVEKGVAFKIEINGELKTCFRGWGKVDDELQEFREMDTKINGVLRGQSFDI